MRVRQIVLTLLFGTLPDSWTIIGAAIVVGSGLYMLMRARSRARGPVRTA